MPPIAIKVGRFEMSPLDAVMITVAALFCLCLLGLGIVAARIIRRYRRTVRF
jgi:hypothetical protein